MGIPSTAQSKDKIAPGDRIVAFVGAPDRAFIGHAVVASPWHEWTDEEATVYPTVGTFSAGIALSDPVIWSKPLPLGAIWPSTQGAKTNPLARWYGTLARLSTADFDLIVDAGTSGVADREEAAAATRRVAGPVSWSSPSEAASGPSAPAIGAAGLPESDALFAAARKVQDFIGSPQPISEEGTRAFFINKQLEALGYTDFDDIEHGSLVASGTFPDYVLQSNGRQVIAIEAKRFGHPLGPKEAAQLVGYGGVLGLPWGILTDGRYLHVYDMPVTVTGVKPHDRVVISIDLGDFADRDDFDTRIWPVAALLTKEAMQSGVGLERYAARELVRSLLSDARSASIEALQRELQQRKVTFSHAEVAALVNEPIG
jgi:hypothetical protein